MQTKEVGIMPGRLKEIVETVKAKATLKNWAVAKLSIAVGQDVSKFSDDTPDDPVLEEKLLKAAKEILKVNEIKI